MKTEQELNEQILKLTEKIRTQFPELVKFIGEMPVKVSYNDTIDPTIKNLQEYYNSLETLLQKYTPDHEGSVH